MSFINSYSVVNDDTFQGRVTAAMTKAAIAVMAELDTTPNHANRISFANRALLNPDAMARKMAHGVASNATIAATIDTEIGGGSTVTEAGDAVSDNDMEFTVNSMWDAYAGV